MEEYIELGSAPTDETPVQVEKGKEYMCTMMAECRRYKVLLDNLFPNKPNECRFVVKTFPHDFGPYCEVVVLYNPKNERSVEFAYSVEGNLPKNWLTTDQRTRQFQLQ